MEIGIIGTGNMGTIITEALIVSRAISPATLTITNRTIAKAEAIRTKYKEIHVVENEAEVAKKARLLIICVKPLDIYPVLQKIKPFLTEEDCVVSITSPITVEQLESVVPCAVARIIPSITNRALAGVALCTFGDSCPPFWTNYLNRLFTHIAKPIEIEEEVTRIASDIVSCGPAFYSYLTQRFVDAAVEETKIDKETATTLAAEMLIGLGELLKKGYYTLPTLQAKVCVKGGITGEGIEVLEEELGDMFHLVFQATHKKFAEDIAAIKKQYTS